MDDVVGSLFVDRDTLSSLFQDYLSTSRDVVVEDDFAVSIGEFEDTAKEAFCALTNLHAHLYGIVVFGPRLDVFASKVVDFGTISCLKVVVVFGCKCFLDW